MKKLATGSQVVAALRALANEIESVESSGEAPSRRRIEASLRVLLAAVEDKTATAIDVKKFPEMLDKLADDLYTLRGSGGLRKAADWAHKLYEDPMGQYTEFISGAHANPRLKDIREQLREADTAMGNAARGAEFLSMVLRGKRKLP